MELRVDPARGVCVGDTHYPYNLDCSTGVASIELDGRSFEVRTLLWREKIVLARFAHLGGAFLKQQFLRLCLREPASLPLSELQQEILAELAIWVNNPQPGAYGLPLDISVLSSVTLDVCRAMQLKPADLDSRDAVEVEMLWQAAQSHSENVETTTGQVAHQQQAVPGDVKAEHHPANEGLLSSNLSTPDSDGWTRILFVPTPAAEAADSPDETQDASLSSETKDELRLDLPSTQAAKTSVENPPAETFRQRSLDNGVAERTAASLSASRAQSSSFIAGQESRGNVRSLAEDKSPAIKKPSISRFRVLAADTLLAETSGTAAARGVALQSHDSGAVETSDHVIDSEIMTGAFEMKNEIQPLRAEPYPFDSQIESRNQTGDLNQHVHVLYPPNPAPLMNGQLQKSPVTVDLPTAHKDSASSPLMLSPAMNEGGALSLLSHTEQELLFEELCERLDEAATEMGID